MAHEILKDIAKARYIEPMNTWPQHNDFHRRNTHPFSGSRYGELYFDEECLRCQLENEAAKHFERPVGQLRDKEGE